MISVCANLLKSCSLTGTHVIVTFNRMFCRSFLDRLTLMMKAQRCFGASGTTGRPVANPVREVRCSGRIQNIILLGPLFPSKKLKFYHPALSLVILILLLLLLLLLLLIIIILIIINEYINLITHKCYLQKEKSNLRFLRDMFWSLEMQFRSSVD